MHKTVTVTTSWDDGHILDVRLASLLERYGLTGTFYITPEDRELPTSERITAAQVKRIAAKHEIGTHTLTHPRLPLLSVAAQRYEIGEGKRRVEKMCGKPVTMFCYTHGEYTRDTIALVQELGFHGARRIDWFDDSYPKNPFRMGTTMQAAQWKTWSLRLICLKNNPRLLPALIESRWELQAMHVFDRIAARGGVFHLWGHSHEIDRNNDWVALERVFAHIASAKARIDVTVQAVPNSALVRGGQ